MASYWHQPSSPCATFDYAHVPTKYAHVRTTSENTLGIEEESLDGSTVGADDRRDDEEERLPTRYLVALTCGIGGLQLVWSTLFSHGSSYLFTLGVSNSQSSLVWAAAPICGTIIQPLVGAISDRCQSRWGRRRPFIFGGVIAAALSLIALAWIEPLIGFIFDPIVAKTASPYGAILALVILNVAIQPLQFGMRALIVDTCPSEQQSVASAWAGRFTGVGNIVAYVVGSLPLPFSFMLSDYETWRFRYMSLLSVATLVATVLITIANVHEDTTSRACFEEIEPTTQRHTSLSTIVGDVISGWKAMSPRIRRVCRIQFFAWMGWFAFHFYSTSYISGLYISEYRHWGFEITTVIKDDGMRIATLASLFSALAALGTTIVLPRMATSESKESHPLPEKFIPGEARKSWWTEIEMIWASSHILYALCTFSTLFITSSTAGTVAVALIGLSMGVTQWAPFAIIGEELTSHYGDLEVCSSADQSGAIMGIHNAVTSIPQIFAALVCSGVFWIAQKKRIEQSNGASWVLSMSGIALVVAACFAWRLRRQ